MQNKYAPILKHLRSHAFTLALHPPICRATCPSGDSAVLNCFEAVCLLIIAPTWHSQPAMLLAIGGYQRVYPRFRKIQRKKTLRNNLTLSNET